MAVSSTYAEWLWWAPVAVTDPSAQEGYQALVTVAYVAGKMRTDFGDLRFTDESDTALSHALVSKTDSSTATFRVKLPANCSAYRVFCGKADATSASDPDATYDFWEDFPGSSLDSSKWDTYSSGAGLSVSGGILTITGDTAQQRGIKSKAAFGTGTVLEARCDLPRVPSCALGWLNSAGNRFAIWSPRASDYEYTETYTGTYESKTYSDIAGTTTKEIRRNGSTSVIFAIDGSVITSHTVRVPTEDCLIQCYSYRKAGVFTIDWILVRKYEATEPSSAIGTWTATFTSTPADLELVYHVLEPVPADLALSYHVLAPVPAGLVACYDLEILPPELAMPYDIRKAADLATPYDIRLAADVETPSAQRTASDLVI